MYLSSITALTNYHKFTGLKQHSFITLQFCRSEGWHGSHSGKKKVLSGLHSFLEVLGRICYLFLFPESLHSWLVALFLHPQSHRYPRPLVFHAETSLCHHGRKCSHILKNLLNYIKPAWLIQEKLPIFKLLAIATSVELLCHEHAPRFQGLRCGYLWERPSFHITT